MQINMYQNPDSGGWIVEFRQPGDRMWTRVGVYGDRSEAKAAYDRLMDEAKDKHDHYRDEYNFERNYTSVETDG